MTERSLGTCVEAIQAAATPDEFIEAIVESNAFVRRLSDGNFGPFPNTFPDPGHPIVFPHPDVKPAGIQEAFGQTVAYENSATRALALGATVNAYHPFGDGNGRVSRLIHAALLGFEAPIMEDMGIVAFHSAPSGDGRARKVIDLKPPRQLRETIRTAVYERTDTEPINYRSETQTSLEDEGILRQLSRRLPMEQMDNLLWLVRPDWKGQYQFQDPDSLTYALAVAASCGVPLIGHTVGHAEPQATLLVNVPKTVAQLDDAEVAVIFDAAWEYRYQRAVATIDCTLPGELGEQLITMRDGEAMTVRECFLRYTNNLVGQTVSPIA